MRTIAEIVAQARNRLLAGGVPESEAPGDAEVLARHALQWDLSRYAAARRDPPPTGFAPRYDALIARRMAREPVSQIVGSREFWGLEFEVNRHVLTPRPDSEFIIEAALAAFDRNAALVILDAGTGSGCLAVALATEFADARVIASDISREALAVARRNAARHQVAHRIAFINAESLTPAGDVDLIVCNPPYLPARGAATLPAEVREYEPHVALFGGDDGFAAYRDLLPAARRALSGSAESRLIVEVGYDQAPEVAALAAQHGWEVERIHRDLQGVERVLTFRPI